MAMALTFNSREAVQKLLGRGLPEPAADGIVEVVEEATSPLVTRDILRAEMAEMRADIWRALYAAVATVVGVVIAAAAVSLTIAAQIL